MLIPISAFAKTNTKSNQIDALLDHRAELICLERYDEVVIIDKQLALLGVEKLTPDEVQKRFIDNSVSPDSISPYVSTPTSNNVTWLSSRESYTYNGKTYEIQTLIAQPNQYSSNLKESGSRAIYSTYQWKAGLMNALSTVASSAAGEIPGASLVLTIYDTVNGFVSGISPTTIISSAQIVYSYAHTTTASFKYVKVSGQSDSYQTLTYISTKGTTAIGYQYPTFTYSGGSATPYVIQGSRTIYSTPSGYNSNLNAVKSYTDVYAAKRSYVQSVKITGIESNTVSTIYPVCPQFPAHIQ